MIRVSVVDALIGPGRMDGAPWDPPGRTVSNEVWEEIGVALESPHPLAAIEQLYGSRVAVALGRPDVEGLATVSLDGSGYGRALRLEAERADTFSPRFRGPPTWPPLPFDERISIAIELHDRDAGGSADEIATVVIRDEDVLAALAEEGVHRISFAAQSNRQLLFVGISAARAR